MPLHPGAKQSTLPLDGPAADATCGGSGRIVTRKLVHTLADYSCLSPSVYRWVRSVNPRLCTNNQPFENNPLGCESNAVHGSDAAGTAAYEIGCFLPGIDLI